MTGRQIAADLDTAIEAAHEQYRHDIEAATREATVRLQKRLADAYRRSADAMAKAPVFTPQQLETHQSEIVDAVRKSQMGFDRPAHIPDPPPAPKIDAPDGFGDL